MKAAVVRELGRPLPIGGLPVLVVDARPAGSVPARAVVEF